MCNKALKITMLQERLIEVVETQIDSEKEAVRGLSFPIQSLSISGVPLPNPPPNSKHAAASSRVSGAPDSLNYLV